MKSSHLGSAPRQHPLGLHATVRACGEKQTPVIWTLHRPAPGRMLSLGGLGKSSWTNYPENIALLPIGGKSHCSPTPVHSCQEMRVLEANLGTLLNHVEVEEPVAPPPFKRLKSDGALGFKHKAGRVYASEVLRCLVQSLACQSIGPQNLTSNCGNQLFQVVQWRLFGCFLLGRVPL